jgi:hypothetical protein
MITINVKKEHPKPISAEKKVEEKYPVNEESGCSIIMLLIIRIAIDASTATTCISRLKRRGMIRHSSPARKTDKKDSSMVRFICMFLRL